MQLQEFGLLLLGLYQSASKRTVKDRSLQTISPEVFLFFFKQREYTAVEIPVNFKPFRCFQLQFKALKTLLMK